MRLLAKANQVLTVGKLEYLNVGNGGKILQERPDTASARRLPPSPSTDSGKTAPLSSIRGLGSGWVGGMVRDVRQGRALSDMCRGLAGFKKICVKGGGEDTTKQPRQLLSTS